MGFAYTVPGVYFEPRPRAAETPIARTDIAGFIGFEPRVRDAGSALSGSPPAGHSFRVEVSGFQLLVGGAPRRVPGQLLELSWAPGSIPVAAGQSVIYAVVAAGNGRALNLLAVKGGAALSGQERPPDDATVDAVVVVRLGGSRPWTRIADVTVRREAPGLRLTVLPSRAQRRKPNGDLVDLSITRCDDFRDYELAFGPLPEETLIEPKARDAFPPSGLTGSPPVGHSFRVAIDRVRLPLGDVVGEVPPQALPLSSDPGAIPMGPGQGIVYAVVAAGQNGVVNLVVVPGLVGPIGTEGVPTDAAVRAAVDAKLGTMPPLPWARLADVIVSRAGANVSVDVHPSWSTAGDTALQDDGTLLRAAVRAFFANGGRRCWVATVRRPNFMDKDELRRAREEMVGVAGASEAQATGLERILLLPEVTLIDAPDLYARRADARVRTVKLPSREREACFLRCDDLLGPGGLARSVPRPPAWLPLFDSAPVYDGTNSNEVFDTQKAMLARCIPDGWRAFLLLSVPLMPDDGSGSYLPPRPPDVQAWVGQFDRLVKTEGFADTDEMSCAALYWPWVLYQEQVDAAVLDMPPSSYAAAIIARRDLARGPQISPANETLKEVVGLAATFGDRVHGALYCPDTDANGREVPSVNVLRPFPGYGVQVWGARTLSTDEWLRFVSVRRTLTAIELRMKAALDLLTFEPNSPALWLQITQVAFSTLMPLFESGALRGERPEEAFYVRCDKSINPPESVALGRLFVEVGVAVAAPMEFIVFRIGRREGVVEVAE